MNSKLIIGIAVLIVAGTALLLFKPFEKQPLSPATQTQLPPEPPTETASDEITQESVIEVTGSGFSPAFLTIKKGTKVTWVNKSGTIVNVSSGPHPVHTSYPPLNLKNFIDGESISLTFDEAGTYGYHDHLNPNRTGTIVVE